MAAAGVPDAHASLAPWKFRHYVRTHHPCLAAIIDVEGYWDTTIDYGRGHGNTSESYGIGQANPGTKMAAFGPDWRTNPWTQLRWMEAYVNGRYHGECAAWEFRRTHGWY